MCMCEQFEVGSKPKPMIQSQVCFLTSGDKIEVLIIHGHDCYSQRFLDLDLCASTPAARAYYTYYSGMLQLLKYNYHNTAFSRS